jgi:predicted GIY-YIG superfamily endonuclease
VDAPAAPGVYVLLGPGRELAYVGKAADLRRRLAEHERAGRLRDVTAAGWEVCASVDDALLREADLIVFLRPSRNRSHTDQEPDWFVSLPPCTDRYGTFPHLAPGSHSPAAKRWKAGFAGLRRLVAAVEVDRRALHDLLAGTSDRVLGTPTGHLDPVRRRAAERDAVAAADFFRVGPRRLRDLRLRHGLPPGPVTAEAVARCLIDEMREVVGDLVLPPPDDVRSIVGRRRARSMRLRRPPGEPDSGA